MNISNKHIVLPGGAGLVGQNLATRLIELGCSNITVIDKNPNNLNILKRCHPGIHCVGADLAEHGEWEKLVTTADYLVMLQAQIGGLNLEEFRANNITSTRNVLDHCPPHCHITHISSSVINSKADDYYTQTKTEQEQLIAECGKAHCILRPTLMFGWFDRKHLGWLSRFMQKTPVFPIPGNGEFVRQPLYVRDFCNIIISAMENQRSGEAFNISGREFIYYIDIIRAIKKSLHSKTLLLPIPYRLFDALLKCYALFDSNPPFTPSQLQALVIDETFEIIDWENIFDVTATPFSAAIEQTLNDKNYSNIALDF